MESRLNVPQGDSTMRYHYHPSRPAQLIDDEQNCDAGYHPTAD